MSVAISPLLSPAKKQRLRDTLAPLRFKKNICSFLTATTQRKRKGADYYVVLKKAIDFCKQKLFKALIKQT